VAARQWDELELLPLVVIFSAFDGTKNKAQSPLPSRTEYAETSLQ